MTKFINLTKENKEKKETTFDMILELDEGVGYPSFRCDFYFLNGKLANHGCWE